MKQYKGIICRGCYTLGTACGKCEKCRDQRLEMAKTETQHKGATSGTELNITHTPTHRYSVQWNFGNSQCSFETMQDLKDFVANDLPGITHD